MKRMLSSLVFLVAITVAAASAQAANGYEVTCKDGDKTITYSVRFGPTKLTEGFTAFDPASKKFVYLSWRRDEKRPEPAMKIWDHRTGETIELYKFPDAEHPLPVIPSIEAMKVCPLTGDKNPKSKLVMFLD